MRFNSGVHSELFDKGFAFCNNISTLQATGSCLTHQHHFSFSQLGVGIEIDSVRYVGIAMKIYQESSQNPDKDEMIYFYFIFY